MARFIKQANSSKPMLKVSSSEWFDVGIKNNFFYESEHGNIKIAQANEEAAMLAILESLNPYTKEERVVLAFMSDTDGLIKVAQADQPLNPATFRALKEMGYEGADLDAAVQLIIEGKAAGISNKKLIAQLREQSPSRNFSPNLPPIPVPDATAPLPDSASVTPPVPPVGGGDSVAPPVPPVGGGASAAGAAASTATFPAQGPIGGNRPMDSRESAMLDRLGYKTPEDKMRARELRRSLEDQGKSSPEVLKSLRENSPSAGGGVTPPVPGPKPDPNTPPSPKPDQVPAPAPSATTPAAAAPLTWKQKAGLGAAGLAGGAAGYYATGAIADMLKANNTIKNYKPDDFSRGIYQFQQAMSPILGISKVLNKEVKATLATIGDLQRQFVSTQPGTRAPSLRKQDQIAQAINAANAPPAQADYLPK